ncbi:MAG: hypothetical protein CL763_10430 [Chloroflexi bacterium]|nr:hypothetical protein [Chloroflexota bacterium]|tara:strand:+ start:9196 stop:10119 length:924 start_codon:yes stop_codon:yes gene_type:complete
MKFDEEGNRVTPSRENEKCKEMWNDFEIPWKYTIREKPGIKIKINQIVLSWEALGHDEDLELGFFWDWNTEFTYKGNTNLEKKYAEQVYIDLLHEDKDYRSGIWKGYDSDRSARLSLAGSNVWQVGQYIPIRFSYAKDDALSHMILKNKNDDSTTSGLLIALIMLIKAKLEKFPLLCADMIVPVPNFNPAEFTKAVSIAEKFSVLLKGNPNVIGCNNSYRGKKINFHNVLKKTIDRSTKGMTRNEKEEFYGENKVYQFNSNYDIKGKNILLIDDVVTAGFTAQQCIKELLENGANSVYFYATATTKN